jgi:hypothetical protein
VPLQIVIAIEALRTLIAFERPIVRYWLLMLMLLVVVHVLGVCRIATVELRHHPMLYIANHRHLVSRTVNVGHDGALHRREGI